MQALVVAAVVVATVSHVVDIAQRIMCAYSRARSLSLSKHKHAILAYICRF